MPEIGEIRRGSELGYKASSGRDRYIWHACIDCGKGRWNRIVHRKPGATRCNSCSRRRERSHKRRRGTYRTFAGYILILLQFDDPFIGMASPIRYVREHRLIMAQHLGRLLKRREVVHHKGTKYPMGSVEDRQDNRLENLELCASVKEHKLLHKKNRQLIKN